MVGEDVARPRAFELLQRDHLKSDKLGPLCQRISYGFCKEYETFLRAAAAKSPHKAIRATAQNADVAMVCGIDVRWVYIMTTGLAAALAAAGGALVSIQFGFNPETGVLYTIQAFAIIILGGRGHYIGALIGGLMLAVLENLVSLLVPNGTAMVEIAAYGLMISVLLIRPRGLLGAKEV